MLSKEQVQIFSKELKIDSFSIYREYLQLLFLKYFYELPTSNQIYFKGGTAIKFLFGSFRFSEDLDFSSTLKEEEIKSLIQKATKNLSREISVSFKQEKSIADSFTGRIFQGISDFSFPLTVRLDISLREKPIYIENKYIETTFPISPYPLVEHLAVKEILAEKIRALIIRGKGRDLFDIWFLLSKKIEIDWDLVNLKMSFYNRKTNLNEIMTVIKEVPDQEIKKDLTKFLPLNQRESVKKVKIWLIEKLKKLEEK
jgi:hypothetical protein